MGGDDSDFESPDSRGKRGRKTTNDGSNKKPKKAPKKKNFCPDCDQVTEDNPNLTFYPGPVHGAVEEESVALFSEELTSKAISAEQDGDDPRQDYRLNDFSFYDESGHLVSYDRESFPEDKKLVFATGYIKGICDDSPGNEGGVPAARIGPIIWWWVGGFTSGEKTLLGVSTEFAHYYLNEPSEIYRPTFIKVFEKCVVSKVVVEKLIEWKDRGEELTYDDLIYAIEDTIVPDGCAPMSSDTLTQHASFVLSQVTMDI